MNSLVSLDFNGQQHQKHVLFLTLVRNDADFVPRPYLARTWDFSPDSTRLVFHLRDDVYWTDGAPVTADDVAFTFRRAKDPRVPFGNRSYFEYWEEVEVLDEHTVSFHLRPHNGFLYGWTQTAIMPAHLLAELPVNELAADPFGRTRPVGAGPFRFVEHIPGERWTFTANPDFPAELGGRPYLDRLIFRVIPEETTLLQELRTGGVDLVTDVPAGAIDAVRADATLRLATYPVPAYTFIAWNSQRPFFATPELRRALGLAIDRQRLVKAVRSGLGSPAAGPVGPWHWAYDSAWQPLPYNPDSARAILDRAGWRDSDGDGVRDRDGVRMSFELLSNGSRERTDISVIVQSELGRIGVEVRPRTREPASLAAAVTSPDRRFDAVILAWVRDPLLNDRDLWACDQVGQPLQFTSYCNPQLDPVLDSIPLTLDRSRLRELIERYERTIERDQPYTFLYFERRADAYGPRLRGFKPGVRGEWAGVTRWWVPPRLRR